MTSTSALHRKYKTWLAERGVHVSRDGLRSGQRAARLRCMGLAAHDGARAAAPDRGVSSAPISTPTEEFWPHWLLRTCNRHTPQVVPSAWTGNPAIE